MRFIIGLIIGFLFGIAPLAIACWVSMASDLYREEEQDKAGRDEAIHA
jgi:hypothetical protein